MSRSSRDVVVYTWEIEDFDHIMEYCLTSPEVQLSPLNNGIWQIVIYPTEKHGGQDYIQCGLRMTPVQTDLHEMTVLFWFELLSEDRKVTAKFGPKSGEFPRDNDLPHPVGLREDFCGMTRRSDCGTLTVRCRVERQRYPSHCIAAILSATTEVLTQRVTEFVEVDFYDDEDMNTEKKIVVYRTLCSSTDGIPQEIGSPTTLSIGIDLEDDEWYQVTLSNAHDASPFMVDCVMSVMDTNGVPYASTAKKTFSFPNGDLSLDVPRFLSRSILKEKSRNLMNEKSKFLLRFDMEFSVADITHHQRTRPVTKPHLPGCMSSSLRVDFERACTNPNHPDWTLSIDPDHPTAVDPPRPKPVHKAILASRSPVFRAMLEQDMMEKSSQVVSLPDMNATTLDKIVRFLYSDCVTFVDNEGKDLGYLGAAEIYRAANLYLLPTLRNECSSYLQWRVSADNASFLKDFADLYDDDQLAEAVKEFLAKEPKAEVKENTTTPVIIDGA